MALTKFVCLWSTASLLTVGVSSQAATISGGTSNTNNRFDTNREGATFVAEGLDLSGVGNTSSNGRWATLISRNVVISARHARPDFVAGGFSNSVTFRQNNDLSGPSFTSTFQADKTIRITGTDLWLSVLTTPAPDGYATYDFTSESITGANFSTSSLGFVPGPGGSPFGNSTNTYAVGHNNGTRTSQWVGRNITDRWQEDLTVDWGDGTAPTTDDYLAIGFGNATGTRAPSVDFEFKAEGGDSGAPLFVDDGSGNLVLVGIAALVDPFEGTPFFQGEETLYSYVGNYNEQIQTFVTDNAIPEPGSIATFALLLGIVGFKRRR